MSSDLPTPNSLRAFEVAGRHLNFRRAAEEMGVSQGAVAQQVRGLEARLGIRLFDRVARGLVLTDAGRQYHDQVARAFEQMRQATRNLRPAPEQVTISVTPSFASRWLIPNLPDFTLTHPDVDLRILATDRVSSFRQDAIDLAVRQGSPPFGATLEATLLFPQSIIAVCAPGVLTTRVADQDDPLDGLVLLHDTHNHWPRFLGRSMPKQGMRFNQTGLGIEAALAGQGVALASRFMVARDLEDGRLVQPVATELAGETDFYLLRRRKPIATGAQDAVWTWLVSRALKEARSA
ncbi:MAG: LysR substrate-binding domain-containing protein [Pseudomonadota bacterium]